MNKWWIMANIETAFCEKRQLKIISSHSINARHRNNCQCGKFLLEAMKLSDMEK